MPTITEDQYKKLKADVESAKAGADRAQGALDTLLTRLKEEFDCSGLKQAKVLLEELSGKKEKAEKAFDRAAKEYQEKWKEE